MNPFDDRPSKFPTAGDSCTTVDRREFLKLTSTGLLVDVRGGAGCFGRARRVGVPGRPRRRPAGGRQRVPAHRRRRPRDLPGRQGRDGPGRDDVAAAARGRGTRRAALVGRHRDGRHRPVPVRRRHVRLAEHPAVRAGAARGRGRSEGRPAADGGRALAGSGRPISTVEAGTVVPQDRSHEARHLRPADRRQAHRAPARRAGRRSKRCPRSRSSARPRRGATRSRR